MKLRNININGNSGDGMITSGLTRRLQIYDSFFKFNEDNGIVIGRNNGVVDVQNVVAEDNANSGFSSNQNYGEVYVNHCAFSENQQNGIVIRVYSYRYNTHQISIVNSSAIKNGNNGVFVYHESCSRMHNFTLADCFFSENYQGLRFEPCQYSRDQPTPIVSGNTFTKNYRIAVYLERVSAITFKRNKIVSNTGTNTLFWTRSNTGGYHRVRFQENVFRSNFVVAVVSVASFSSYSTSDYFAAEFTGNVFENNTCFTVMSIQWDPLNTNDELNVLTISDNHFINNIPRPVVQFFTPLRPIATIALDISAAEITNNVFRNSLFPIELLAKCESYDKTVNATMNYWGTNNETDVQEKIYDSSDRYEFCNANYFPFLNSLDQGDISTNVRGSSVMFRRNNTIGGVVKGTVILPKSDFDYVADRDIIIPQGGKLIIEAGVNIYFSHFTSMFVRGQLIALGTSENEITFGPFYQNNTIATVRLVDGSTPWEGRLEIFIENTWKTVCYRYWTTSNGRVVCRQLGLYAAVNGKLELTLLKGRQRFDTVSTSNLKV